MRRLAAVMFAVALVVSACGGGADDEGGADNTAGVFGQDPSGDDPAAGNSGPGSAEDPTPEASGSLDSDSIRIGNEVWNRTLPMTSGQCYVFKDDGNLPDSANAWGTLNNDDGLEFSASHGQDGSFEAQVRSDNMYWLAGERSPGTELTIELDHDNLTLRGEGIFNNIHTNEFAYGSFEFVCEDDGTGT